MRLKQTWAQYWSQFPEGIKSEQEQIRREQEATAPAAAPQRISPNVAGLFALPVMGATYAKERLSPRWQHEQQVLKIAQGWQKANPQAKLPGPLFVQNKGGPFVVNHNLFDTIPELHQLEKARRFSYKNPHHDPLIQHAHTSSFAQTRQAIKTQGLSFSKHRQIIESIHQQNLAKNFDQFVRESPHLARAYQNHPHVQAALRRAGVPSAQPARPPLLGGRAQSLKQFFRPPPLRPQPRAASPSRAGILRRPAGISQRRGFLSLPIPNPASIFNPARHLTLILLAIIGSLVLFVLLEDSGVAVQEEPGASAQITKEAKDRVENEEQIVYTIMVTVTGAPDDVLITDVIPDNATLAQEPVPPPTRREGNALVWSMKALQQGGSRSPAPSQPPTDTTPFQPDPNASGTIHNLGFGPSDANRIDALIQKLRPGSKMRGSDIVKFAGEFNIDPLLIFIAINESQLCTDTGVVSPGGSDPDNYNCGGITWDAADGASPNSQGILNQTELDRWSARPQTEAADNDTGHVFAFVPTPRDGVGLFFNYIGRHPSYQGKSPQEFYNIYNPCGDPGNQGRFACGEDEINNILNIIRQNVGPEIETASVNAQATVATFAPLKIILTLQPKDNTYVVNQATAEVIPAGQ